MSTAIHRPRGVLGGAVILAIGVAFLLTPLGVKNGSLYLFITLGLAFLAAYYLGSRQFIYLMPAATLLAFGVGLLLPTWYPGLSPDFAGPVLLGTQALGFVVVWAAAHERWWPLVPAAILGAVAMADAFARVAIIAPAAQPYFVPVMLIGVGAYLLRS